MADEIRYVDANGLKFAYLEEGSGPLVLMLHGFPDTAHTWDDLRPRIAANGYRTATPYMRGYRPTAIPDRDADQETLARDPLALIQALGENEAIVIAHDWGASAAYGAAGLDPDRVRKLFVIGIPHPAAVKPNLKKLWSARHFAAYKLPGAPGRFAKNDFAALPAIYRRWSPAWNPAPEEFDAIRACFSDPASLNAAFGYYRQLTLTPSASLKARIKVPTVVFAGLDDPIVAPSDYRGAREDVREGLHRRGGSGRAFHASGASGGVRRTIARSPLIDGARWCISRRTASGRCARRLPAGRRRWYRRRPLG